MKKLLMISYFYPPLNDVGVLRTVGFASHLMSFGWTPFILTVKNPDLNFCSLDLNQSYPKQIVYRSRSIANYYRFAGRLDGLISRMAKPVGVNFGHELIPNLLLVPDFACGWIPLTVLKGLQIISTQKIDLIFATCKPNSSAIIGAILSKLTGKRLIIDLRDPWRRGIVQKIVGNQSRAYNNVGERWKGFVDEILETKTLQRASKIILTTQETLQVYSKLYPLLKNRFEVIYNGYVDDFFTQEPEQRFDEFTIIYSGSYYYYLDKSEAFFQALANIKKANKLNGNIRFIYIGKSAIVSKMIEKYNLSGTAHCVGYLGRKEAIDLVRSASVILLRNIKPHLSTKLFEGLASGIPLLALTSEGEAGDLIRQYSRSSMIVGDSNPIEIEDAIRSMYTKWAEKNLVYEVSSAFKERFSKYRLTEQFAGILNRCVEENGGDVIANA